MSGIVWQHKNTDDQTVLLNRIKDIQMNKVYLISIGLLFQLMSVSVTAGDNWMVRIDPENRSRCLLESATHVFNDGQAETSAKLVYTGDALYAATKSNIDIDYPGVGLQVDRYDQFPVDELYMKKTVVFSKDINKIHKQFIDGIKAKLTIGFWPLLPKTKPHVIEFSLIGYTKAYQQFLNCKKVTN